MVVKVVKNVTMTQCEFDLVLEQSRDYAGRVRLIVEDCHFPEAPLVIPNLGMGPHTLIVRDCRIGK
jgi:hypothetical protein